MVNDLVVLTTELLSKDMEFSVLSILEKGEKSTAFKGEGEKEFYLQELLLARYARKLLMQEQMKKLLEFAHTVNHDLLPWLIRERYFISHLSLTLRRRAAVVDDLGTALAILHMQFQLPYPDKFLLEETTELSELG